MEVKSAINRGLYRGLISRIWLQEMKRLQTENKRSKMLEREQIESSVAVKGVLKEKLLEPSYLGTQDEIIKEKGTHSFKLAFFFNHS